MEVVTTSDFEKWASSAGVGVHPRYPESGCLTLLPPGDYGRFWVFPGEPSTWPHFAVSFLDGLDDWSWVLLWPRSGAWPAAGEAGSLNERVRDVLLQGAGIPTGRAGVLRFGVGEADVVVAILFAYLAFGWCGDDDLFIIPDHGRQLIQTDHHDVIHAQSRSEERIQEFVAHMATAGYELPTDLPDGTFNRPDWMGPERE